MFSLGSYMEDLKQRLKLLSFLRNEFFSSLNISRRLGTQTRTFHKVPVPECPVFLATDLHGYFGKQYSSLLYKGLYISLPSSVNSNVKRPNSALSVEREPRRLTLFISNLSLCYSVFVIFFTAINKVNDSRASRDS